MTTFATPTNPERFEGEYGYMSGGRLAERHPNRYPSDPHVRLALTKAQGAVRHLAPWQNHAEALPPEALADLTRAYELLDDLDKELPRVYGYVCRYAIRFGSMSRPHFSEFSAHESLVDAIRWARKWEEQFPKSEDGDGSCGPWEIVWAPARIIHFRHFGADPEPYVRRV